MKTGKALGPSAVSLELSAASWVVGMQVMGEICQSPRQIRNARELALIYKVKGDIRHCSCYEAGMEWNEGGGNGVRKKTS